MLRAGCIGTGSNMASVRRVFATYNGPDGVSTAYYEYDDTTDKILSVGVTNLGPKEQVRMTLITDADGTRRKSTLTTSRDENLSTFNLLMVEDGDEAGKMVLRGEVSAEWQ